MSKVKKIYKYLKQQLLGNRLHSWIVKALTGDWGSIPPCQNRPIQLQLLRLPLPVDHQVR